MKRISVVVVIVLFGVLASHEATTQGAQGQIRFRRFANSTRPSTATQPGIRRLRKNC